MTQADLVTWSRNNPPRLDRCVGCGALADHPARPRGLAVVDVRDVGGIRDGVTVTAAVCEWCAPEVGAHVRAYVQDGVYRAQRRLDRPGTFDPRPARG